MTRLAHPNGKGRPMMSMDSIHGN
ncbi:hypothetical protein BN12_2620022 [Nostocoides japonicum T1-X7]|uniref:Uncharacterized protein n=1 Tax=Nostocoides japonicum T1-X7 TaxID=1194083 RepID=A0A077LZ96_9MICO|nr:hypothetical protein BN12_2620022 [Tetrasphaera japonica T1-X7]